MCNDWLNITGLHKVNIGGTSFGYWPREQCSSTTACAIPGMESPSLKLVLESNAHVGTKSTRFQVPLASSGRI